MPITRPMVWQARNLLESEVQDGQVTGWGLWDGNQPGDRVRCLSNEEDERFAVACSTFRVNPMKASGVQRAIRGNQYIRSVPAPSVILLFCSADFTDEALEHVTGGDCAIPVILLSRTPANSIGVPAYDTRILPCDWDLAVAFHRALEESIFEECGRPLGRYPAAEHAAPTEADERVETGVESVAHDGSGTVLSVETDPKSDGPPPDEDVDLLTDWRRKFGDRTRRINLRGTRNRLVQRLAAGRFADDFAQPGGEMNMVVNMAGIIRFIQTDHPEGVGREPDRVTKNTHGDRIKKSLALVKDPDFPRVAEPEHRDAAFRLGASLGLLVRHLVDANPLPPSDAVSQHDAAELSEWVFRGAGVKGLKLPSWLDSDWLTTAFEEALRD